MKTIYELHQELTEAMTKQEALKMELQCEINVELGLIDDREYDLAREMHSQNHHLIQCIEDWEDDIEEISKDIAKYWLYVNIEK